MMMASAEAPTEVISELVKRLRNSARGVDAAWIVSGDSPSDFHPVQLGVNSRKGISCPFMMLGAILKEVVTVQKIGNRQTTAHSSSAP